MNNWRERKEKVFLDKMNEAEKRLCNEFYHPHTMTRDEAHALIEATDTVMNYLGFTFNFHTGEYERK